MQVNDYQQSAAATALYPDYAKVLYPVLGICGEVGELVAKTLNAMWPYGDPIPEAQYPYHEALLAMIGAGQRCEGLKKVIRGGGGFSGFDKDCLKTLTETVLTNPTVVDSLTNEAADVEWYLCALLTDMKVTLEHALIQNLAKLHARKAKGQIHNHTADSREDKTDGA